MLKVTEMTYSSKLILSFFWLLGACLCSLEPESLLSFLYAVLTLFIVGSWVQERSSVHMMFYLGYATFIYLPGLLNWWYLDISLTYFFACSFISTSFLYFTRHTEFIANGPSKSNVPTILLVVTSLVFLLLASIGMGYTFRSLFPFIIVQMAMAFEQGNKKRNLLLFLFFLSVYFSYALTLWSGFGRVVVMGWLFVALLYYLYSVNYRVNKYAFALVPGVAASFFSSRDLLELEFNGFESALNDSAYSPYRLATTFIENFYSHGYDFAGFFEQVFFMVFIFIPRSLWSEKPQGFGFEYVLRNLDSSLAESGHSVAATLIGEHIYFLGYLGLFTGFLAVYGIALLTRMLYRIRRLNGNGVILFSASMMVLVWGGMSSFAARVAWPILFFLVLYLIFRGFLHKKVVFR